MGLTAKEFAYHKEVQELKQERDDIDRVANMYADEVATRIIKTVKLVY
ncbi:MAG: hypothetical protein IID03_12795 [Candidatus Dadabacteria bacterium]|nr:hypothetical protein [Candidatus Dadabacteria bacterium]